MNDFIRQLLDRATSQLEFPDPELLRQGAARRTRRSPSGSSATTASGPARCTATTSSSSPTGIGEITEKGVRTADGVEHEVDVLIYGTGFQASKFLTPMQVAGRGGVDLHERWDGDARAYLGITVPGFPNLFLMYGPNTNIVVNGSIIYFSECEAHYIVESVRAAARARARGRWTAAPRCTTPTTSASTPPTARWRGAPSTVNSWYKNATGRVGAELALLPARVLAADPDARPRRLRADLI